MHRGKVSSVLCTYISMIFGSFFFHLVFFNAYDLTFVKYIYIDSLLLDSRYIYNYIN